MQDHWAYRYLDAMIDHPYASVMDITARYS